MAGRRELESLIFAVTVRYSNQSELTPQKMVPKIGLEPTTYGLQNRCSAIELFRHKMTPLSWISHDSPVMIFNKYEG